jgi:Protein of unknown function (DUF2783)
MTDVGFASGFANQLVAPDDFYEALLDVHQGLSTAESHALNARLVLLLANAVGDMTTLKALLAAARRNVPVQSIQPPTNAAA